jgi:hypothetical protein
MILSLDLINFSKKHFKFSQEKKSKKIKEKKELRELRKMIKRQLLKKEENKRKKL